MSRNAELVAFKISESISKPEIVNLSRIIQDSGYSYSTSRSPQRVTETKSFKKAMLPLIEKLDKQINKIADELDRKDLTEVEYRDLSHGLDIFIKNKQLLSGGATERILTVEVSQEIKDKNVTDGSPKTNS